MFCRTRHAASCAARGLETSLRQPAGPLTNFSRCASASSARVAPPGSTRAHVYYQSAGVPTSILSTGLVGTTRDSSGSDGEFFGVDPIATEVEIQDGRGQEWSLNENGFELVQHPWQHIDYYNNQEVLDTYYAECEALVCRSTGAKSAVAFDHNIRAKARKAAGEALQDGNAVQEPLITYGVHNDYTATSAPTRIRQLAERPKNNDAHGRETAPIDPGRVDRLLRGRWMFVNVWRNITKQPVERFPLGVCDAATTSADELVVFEIRYSDRVGQNYFAQHSPAHRWYYFPRATRDEVVILKCWDSRGRTFLEHMPGSPSVEGESVAATFSLHSGFVDPATPTEAPDRESIEVRLIVFFED